MLLCIYLKKKHCVENENVDIHKMFCRFFKKIKKKKKSLCKVVGIYTFSQIGSLKILYYHELWLCFSFSFIYTSTRHQPFGEFTWYLYILCKPEESQKSLQSDLPFVPQRFNDFSFDHKFSIKSEVKLSRI